jgi:predicted amidohydrolase
LALAGGKEATVGVLICYDRVFPEAARTLALRGAEVVFVPNAGPLCANRVAQVRTRAFENQLAVAVANYPGGAQGGSSLGGGSLVCDGIAFDPDGSPRDHTVAQAGELPAVLTADVSLEALRVYRAAQPWGLGDRVPVAYE